ncbi:MAG: hypothetical protein CME06_12475 [Gemmatimonadetes bacterium]|nr:hypothetical protein [Gemmatimonadota bacterium]
MTGLRPTLGGKANATGKGPPVRIFVAVVLLVVAWSRIDPAAVANAISHAAAGPLLVSFLVLVAERFVTIAKWLVLLEARGWKRPRSEAMLIYWSNNFVGLFLPTGLGLDVLNAFRTHRAGMRLADATSVVTVDRVLSLVSLAGVVTVAWLLATDLKGELTGAVIALGAAIVAVAFIATLPWQTRILTTLSRFGTGEKIALRLASFHESVVSFRHDRWALSLSFLLSVVAQLLRVLEVAVMAHAFGPGLGWRKAMVVVPAANAVTALPISIGGGLGLRENAYLYLFPRVGVSENDAMALSVLVFAWVVIWVLPGGLLAFARRSMPSA